MTIILPSRFYGQRHTAVLVSLFVDRQSLHGELTLCDLCGVNLPELIEVPDIAPRTIIIIVGDCSVSLNDNRVTPSRQIDCEPLLWLILVVEGVHALLPYPVAQPFAGGHECGSVLYFNL